MKFVFIVFGTISALLILSIVVISKINNERFERYTTEIKQKDWIYQGSPNDLQAETIQKRLYNCMDISIYNADIVDFWPHKLSKETSKHLYEKFQEDCSSELIDSVAIGGNDQSGALIYFLENKGIVVSDHYKKYAKQDDLALANLHF
jgi:hypothetical protein